MGLFKKKETPIRFGVPLKEGLTVELLFTGGIYDVAKRLGVVIDGTPNNGYEVLTIYADIMYCAAMNFWELSEEKGNAPFSRVDFHSFYMDNPDGFKKAAKMAMDAAQRMLEDINELVNAFKKWEK